MSSTSVRNRGQEPISRSESLKSNVGTATTRRYQTRSSNTEETTDSTPSITSLSTSFKASQKRKAVAITQVSKSEAGITDSPSENRKVVHSVKLPKTSTGKGRGTRITDKYIIFWGGVLSNWNLGSTFSGKRVIELLAPRLAEQEVEHPGLTTMSTRLLEHHNFVCGEQAMMAFKAWLFEKNQVLEQELAKLEMNGSDTNALFNAILGQSKPSKVSHPSLDEVVAKARKTYLCQILLSSSPRDQKTLGRKVPQFSPEVWDKSCVAIVVSASIARAECEENLKKLYLQAGDRKFVEGSPMDRIWGIGLKWDDPRAEAEENWRGRNLLGKCHDQAAVFLRGIDV
ncbi:uncharacterized protein A1O9_02486 [Exophiala aquamarina CBS 119918]|uniref:NADAR domain-containing protein n=1 Tax=Exophiala aquamarina CBS 119918 TaxID=1182545 RepID=A0A072PME5_9EURO|nr:uncharacterized protein A1O9_02486 [Exophiala aquamarina CBS 119918]KEF60922.1 hypothetical protein A1O9_02486 [Exophiala aquamarina CBS 119918]